MDPHRLAELRSLAYHREIAVRLLVDPAVLDSVRCRVDGWLRDGSVARVYAAGWAEVLALPVAEIVALITCDDPRWAAMRQCSPFTGILGPRERWRIHAEIAASTRGEP